MVRRGRSICRVAAVAGFVVGTAVLPVAAAGAAQSKPARGPRVGTLLATVHDPVGSIGGDDNEYGGAIAISKTILVVGEDGANGSLGVTFIYVEGRSGWPKLPTVTLYDPAQTFYDLFGESVAISGNTLIVGARVPTPGPAPPTSTLRTPADGRRCRPSPCTVRQHGVRSDFGGHLGCDCRSRRPGLWKRGDCLCLRSRDFALADEAGSYLAGPDRDRSRWFWPGRSGLR